MTGPSGIALVPYDLVEGARSALWRRTPIGDWITWVRAGRRPAFLLDLEGPMPYLTSLGGVRVRGRAIGTFTDQEWTFPIWAWAIDPGDWHCIEACLGLECPGGWARPSSDCSEAGEVRIGWGIDEVEMVSPTPPSSSSLPTTAATPTAMPPSFSSASKPMRRGSVAYLLRSGQEPIELSRDVIVGRDPDPSILVARPGAGRLTVASPATEISRSHCAVLVDEPGACAIMDLGSANGTSVRHRNGDIDDVRPMSTRALVDGDLIDVGENTLIEVRIR